MVIIGSFDSLCFHKGRLCQYVFAQNWVMALEIQDVHLRRKTQDGISLNTALKHETTYQNGMEGEGEGVG